MKTALQTSTAAERVAIVTGAASGIGKQCCLDLLAAGWHVYALDVSLDALTHLKQTQGPHLRTVMCDVSNERSIAAALEIIVAQVKHVSALICSAGILRTGSLMSLETSAFDQLFAVNTRGAWLVAKHAHPLLAAAASNEHPARIIMVGSIASIRPKVGGGAYSASKAALATLVRVMGVELAAENILVNAIAPATVDTPMIHGNANASEGNYKPSGVSPLGRIAGVADITGVIGFLLSPAANYMTGTLLPVDGGTSAAFVPR
ncbi:MULTISPECIES: SDR family NAD(P)-dependent oxidoreductase [unclassified Pseudomonas]|uniref:SDR family NAD(P)-dependent oxidoreductase n=1 Tax=unclassified Pseudomonas TaxID=196821 RepID=UPI0025F9E463|nr:MULTISPECIES: SDR family oxidoreductase [unclassified Pseudomonas]